MSSHESEWSNLEVTHDDLHHFAALSGDDNPIHLDEEFARSAGHESVIVHGMLTMALASRALGEAVPGADLVGYRMKFLAPVPVGSQLSIRAERDGETALVDVRVQGSVANGAATFVRPSP